MREAIRTAKRICRDLKARGKACRALDVPHNRVFRAIVRYQLLNDMDAAFLKPTEQEKKEKEVLKN